jgi:hypothetical protein
MFHPCISTGNPGPVALTKCRLHEWADADTLMVAAYIIRHLLVE